MKLRVKEGCHVVPTSANATELPQGWIGVITPQSLSFRHQMVSGEMLLG